MQKVNKINLHCTINGSKKNFQCYPMARLLDVLRENNLTGTKEGCGEGECGSCSVLVNGDIVNSCLIPIVQMQNKEIKTIEGLTNEQTLNKIQLAFLKYGGTQCGICTPGMIIAACKLLEKNQNPTLQDIKTALAGNLCRCTGYSKIFASVLAACQEQRP